MKIRLKKGFRVENTDIELNDEELYHAISDPDNENNAFIFIPAPYGLQDYEFEVISE